MGREGKKGHEESLGEDGNVHYLDCGVYIGQNDQIGHSKYVLFIVLYCTSVKLVSKFLLAVSSPSFRLSLISEVLVY